VQTREGFIDDQAKQVDGFLNFIYALLGMSVFIAVLGIVITLLLAVYERRRELGLVRAIGMTRPQVRQQHPLGGRDHRRARRADGHGARADARLHRGEGARGPGAQQLQRVAPSIVVFVIASIVVAVVAAWVPARRAANADVLQAIATT
jgi:putative ABC transport system permease protein